MSICITKEEFITWFCVEYVYLKKQGTHHRLEICARTASSPGMIEANKMSHFHSHNHTTNGDATPRNMYPGTILFDFLHEWQLNSVMGLHKSGLTWKRLWIFFHKSLLFAGSFGTELIVSTHTRISQLGSSSKWNRDCPFNYSIHHDERRQLHLQVCSAQSCTCRCVYLQSGWCPWEETLCRTRQIVSRRRRRTPVWCCNLLGSSSLA